MAGTRIVLKVAFVGEQKTGKSSIINRYVDGKLPQEPTFSNTGIDFRQKSISLVGQEYSYEIWDVPNWKVLENLGLSFWKDICGCVLVFDVTKAPTFCIFDRLYSSIQSVLNNKDAPMVVVGNMADRVSSEREVSTEMADEWCRKVGVSYFEVSALTGSGVTEMFMSLAEKALLFYHHHDTSSQQSTAKSSLFSVQRPFFHKVTTKLKFTRKRATSMPSEETDEYNSDRSPSTSVFSSFPINFRVPWVSKNMAQKGDEDLVDLKQEQLQRQIEVDGNRVKMLQEKVNRQESELRESVLLQSQLKRNLDEKEAQCERLEKRNQILQQQVAEFQAEQERMHKVSPHWEVKKEEVELHKTEIVGTGAWGYVVEGTFRGQKVAVKCLHNLIRQPHFIKLIRREFNIMAQLRHPHLLLFIAVVVENVSSPLIITELLDTSLRRAYEQDQLQQSNIVSIFQQVASALNYLHLQSPGIIHRDVSSANVLLERMSEQLWKAKLSDFGSANLLRQSSTVGPGAIVYAAPELRIESGMPQTPKVDVYSFGVLLAEVLLCQFPSIEEFPAMQETVRVVWPSAYPLVFNCTKEEPTERPSIAQVLNQLNHLTLTDSES